jgi:hypothetical protein
MRFDMVENEPSILNGIQHTPLCFPSHTAWQTVDQGTVNKLGQVLLQGHTTCVRYMGGGITFETALVVVDL